MTALPPFLLQAAELTKVGTDALGAVGSHAAKDPVQAILWVIILALSGICFWQWKKAESATTTKTQAIADALKEARAEWAKELAIDNGNSASLQAQMREQFEKQVAQLRDEKKEMSQQLIDVNKELRQQIGNDARVLEATATSLRTSAKTAQAINANQAEILRVLAVIAPPGTNVRPAIFSELL